MSPVGAERGQHRRLRLPLSIRATTLTPPVRYAVALASAGVVILLRHAIDPLWGIRFTFTMLYPAIVVSAWLGGFGPGMVATLSCAVAATYVLGGATELMGKQALKPAVGPAPVRRDRHRHQRY